MLRAGTSSQATRDVELLDNGVAASPTPDWRSSLIPVATFFGFAIPAVSYLWMIHTYGVNVIFFDQWNDVALIGHAFSGTLQLSTLWGQHNENRIFFPNLIVLALAYTTHLNVVTEEYLSAIMLFGATALVVCAHKRRSPGRLWIWYCPVAFLQLSLAQAANALWGFQMAWYLLLLTVALALFLLDQEPQRWPVVGGAIAAAVIASFSSLQGLLVWPAGLLLICLRRRPRHLAIAWISAAVLAGVIYFVGFDFNDTDSNRSSPTALFTFFLRVVGDVVGDTHPGVLETLFGSVVVVTAIWVLVRSAFWGGARTGGRPFALSLILFGLLSSGLIAYGRSGSSVFGVSLESRYSIFSIFVLVGLYLAVLDPPVDSEPTSAAHVAASPDRSSGSQRNPFTNRSFNLARVVVGTGIVLTVVFGSVNGIAQARAVREGRIYAGEVTVRANQYPNQVVVGVLAWLETPQVIRHQITIARNDHLSLFATGDADKYLSEAPLKFSLPRAFLIIPRKGATLHGEQILDLFVSDPFDVTRIDYVLSGPDREQATLASASRTKYGWVTKWNTSTVPNGSYSIRAKVGDSGGRSVWTSPVEVLVENTNRPVG
jgi:hypothetical protein